MALEKAELQPSSSWFLTARGGDLSLRVQQQICIGEDDTGDLTFGSNPAGRLIECSVVLGQLTVRAVSADTCLRDKNGNDSSEITLEHGVALTLALPHNVIRLRGDDGTTSSTINLRLLATAAEQSPQPLQAPRRPTSTAESVLDPTAAPVEDTGAKIPTLTQRLPDLSGPDLAADAAAAPELSEITDLLAPILVQEAAAGTTGEQRLVSMDTELLIDRSSHGSLLGLILMALLLLAIGAGDAMRLGPASLTDLGREMATLPAEEKRLVLLASTASLLATDPAPPASPAGRPPPAIAPLVTAAVHTPVAAEKQLSEAAQRMLELRLQQARDYLRGGDIISPAGANAVMVLNRILTLDPTNTDAQALMVECADSLLQQAQQAQAAGDSFAARNLVEEVLAFDPTHAAANRLWSELTAPPAN